MQRAALATMVSVGLWLSACGDKAAPAIVDEDTIRWQLTGSSLSFKPHSAVEADLDVTCSISGDNVEFTIEAPRLDDRPGSKISVRRGSPGAGTCIVEVTEAPNLMDSAFRLKDSCAGTDANGGCTLTGAFDKDGWEFDGTLTCNKLTQGAGGASFSLVTSVENTVPVVIKLDNCD